MIDSWLLRNGQNCTSNFRNTVHWSVSPCLPSILDMSESKKRQLKIMTTKTIHNYELSHVIKRICPLNSKLQRIDFVYKGKKVEGFFEHPLLSKSGCLQQTG